MTWEEPEMKDEGSGEMASYDPGPTPERFLAEVLSGLRKPQKELPSKYFYDEQGSHLFERICELEEYYIPGIEASIMQACVGEIAELIGPRAILIEFGSGNCEKVRFLLGHLCDPVAYVPIDIAREQLRHVAKELASEYPALEVSPVCADYLSRFDLPKPERTAQRVCIYFPGSTIGNFDPMPARRFLEYAAAVCGQAGALLIGVDLKKDPAVLHSAYNDKAGITAAFNLNLLARINRELDCDFRLAWFQHYAFYNPRESRVELHLISDRSQAVHLKGETICFAEGESIRTESSYKYNLEEFAHMVATSGFRVERVWLDERRWFSVQYLVPW